MDWLDRAERLVLSIFGGRFTAARFTIPIFTYPFN